MTLQTNLATPSLHTVSRFPQVTDILPRVSHEPDLFSNTIQMENIRKRVYVSQDYTDISKTQHFSIFRQFSFMYFR